MTRKDSRPCKSKPGAIDPSPAVDDTRPANLDELLLRLHRRLANMEQTWRSCDKKLCRRTRCCRDAGVHCIRSRPPPDNSNPQERAQALHQLRVMLDNALRERGLR